MTTAERALLRQDEVEDWERAHTGADDKALRYIVDRFVRRLAAARAGEGERMASLINAIEKLVEVTYTAAIEEGDPELRMARIHARAAIAFARSPAVQPVAESETK